MPQQIKLGIVGVGIMGATHVRHALRLQNTDLAAICERNPTRLEEVDAPDHVARYSDYTRMLDECQPDAVLIATPHYDHPPMALAAFERGIHVLTEKPIAVHTQAAQNMIDGWHNARERYPDLVFAAMFMQRTWGWWRKIKAMLDSGQLGQLIRATWIVTDWFRTQRYYDMGGWRATWKGEGGGVLMNQCPHNLDLYQWMVGLPARVHGFASFGKHHRIEVEDEVTAYFEHDNGMVGHFITTTGESPGSNRLEIVGENGKLIYENGELAHFRNAWSSRKQIAEATAGFEKVPATRETVDFGQTGGNGHDAILENFADAILHGADLIAPAQEGINSVALNNAIVLSAHTGKPVALPNDGSAFAALLQEFIENPPT